MNRFLLFLLMLPSALWKRLGADVEQLRAILHVKLMMDNRKPLSFGNNRGVEHKKKKDRKYTTWLTMFFSFLMGFVYVFPVIITEFDPVIGLAFFYTMFIFIFTFTLITDFANVLIDTKDKFVLFSRPVSDRTIMFSRLLYIMIYLLRLVIPMSLPAWIVFGIIKGWKGALFFPFPLVLLVFVVLFLVSALYLLMLRLASPGRFKDVLNYFQIGFSIVFFAVWMISSRMINPEGFKELRVETYDWVKYFPSYWIAVCWTWVEGAAKVLPGTRWMSALAILFPIASLWATVKFLAPHFIRSLVASDNDNAPAVPVAKSSGKKSTKKQFYTWANLFNKSDAAKAGFLLTWLQTSRSRTFKMRVYPSFAYVPVYFFFILMQGGRSFTDVWDNLSEGQGYIGLLYLTTFVIMQAINYITMSEQYKAAWVYYATPVDKPGDVIAGAYRAMWVKYFMPFMAAISVFVLFIWGGAILFDIILATVNITLFSVVIMRMSNRALPFSRKEQMKDSGFRTMVRVLGTMFLMGVLWITHYGISNLFYLDKVVNNTFLSAFISTTWLTVLSLVLKLVFLVLSSVFLWLVFDSLRNTDWKSLQKSEQYL